MSVTRAQKFYAWTCMGWPPAISILTGRGRTGRITSQVGLCESIRDQSVEIQGSLSMSRRVCRGTGYPSARKGRAKHGAARVWGTPLNRPMPGQDGILGQIATINLPCMNRLTVQMPGLVLKDCRHWPSCGVNSQFDTALSGQSRSLADDKLISSLTKT